MTRVLVLGGGPDAERAVSIDSARGVHQACVDAGLDAELLIVDEPSEEEIVAWDAEVIFPVLHGKFGEGGALQERLERAGLAFVGSGFHAASLAMDKLATKLIASGRGVATPEACVLDAGRLMREGTLRSPIDPPVVVKPVHDGSSVGLHICRDGNEWERAIGAIREDIRRRPQRTYMIERYHPGRELTAAVIADPDNPGKLKALPIIEIAPKSGVYDFQAKYERNDTVYTVDPPLAAGLGDEIRARTLRVCSALGVRHLARVDYLLGEDGACMMLEVNTMPGFTPTSLLPKAAAAVGLPMPMLCAHLVRCALRDRGAPAEGNLQGNH